MSISGEAADKLKTINLFAVQLPYETDGRPLTDAELTVLAEQAVSDTAHHIARAQLYMADCVRLTQNAEIEAHIGELERTREYFANLPGGFRV
jgi:hypothetical protein